VSIKIETSYVFLFPPVKKMNFVLYSMGKMRFTVQQMIASRNEIELPTGLLRSQKLMHSI
jgi:hypothetical protein